MSIQAKLSSGYSDDEIKRAAEIREWLVKLISDKHEEIENLRATLSLVDSMLKLGSFKPASSLKDTLSLQLNPTDQSSLSATGVPNHQQTVPTDIVHPDNRAAGTENSSNPTDPAPPRSQITEYKELHRMRDNLLLAKAEFTRYFVDIVPVEDIQLSTNTPPFRSFFLGRILDGMKVKDEEKVRNSQIKESESLSYVVEENENNIILKIRINNYREKERLNEIFNTCAWVFSRMIEKGSR